MDPKENRGSQTVGYVLQHVERRGLEQTASNSGEHMFFTLRWARPFLLFLLVTSQNNIEILLYDLRSISLILGCFGKFL